MIQWKKKFLPFALLAVLAVGLAGCGGQGDNGQSAGKTDKEIKIGATAGPHAEVVEAVAKEAENRGFTSRLSNFPTILHRIRPWPMAISIWSAISTSRSWTISINRMVLI